MQLGIAIQDCGVDFGSLITSSTEVRLATGLRCQITDSGPNAALAIIENHANFDGDVIALQQFLLSSLNSLPANEWKLQAEKTVRSLRTKQDQTNQALKKLASLLRKMRSPQMASLAAEHALDQPYARLAVLDLIADKSPHAEYRLKKARQQIELEEWLESLDRFDRQREIEWFAELHGSRALFTNDHRPGYAADPTLGGHSIDAISADFISNRTDRVMSRALHGQLGESLFDPLARHMIQMELSDRPTPTLECLWGSWDPERGVFPVRLSCRWPESLDIQAVRLERMDGMQSQSWIQARDFEYSYGAFSDSVAPSDSKTLLYRATWAAELPGSEVRGEWGTASK